MTVQSQLSRADYLGNGVTTTPFAVPFRFLRDTHLKVLRTVIATNVTTELVLDSLGANGFSVEGAGQPSGGVVTVVTAPAVGERLSILRNMPFTQLIDYIANDAFPAESHETGLDERTMENGQLLEVVGRAITLPAQTTGVSTDLPAPTALNLLRWNATETALENAVPPAIATVADGAVVDATVSPIAGIQGSKLNFLQAGVGALDRSVQDKQRERVSVLDYIPPNLHASIQDGTNATDLLAYLQLARDACLSFTRAKLVFPAGFYLVSGAFIVVQQGLHLSFEGGAQLITNHPTANVLQIGDGVTNPAQVKVIGLYARSTVLKTNGAAIYLYGGNDITLSGIIIDGATLLHDGIVFRGAPGQFGHYLDRFQISGCNAESIRLDNGGVGVDLVSDVFLSRGVIHGNNAVGTTGILFLGGSGTYLHKIDVIGCDYGIRTLPATGNQVLYTFGTQVLADTCLTNGFSLDDAGGKVLGFRMSTGWSNSSTIGLFCGGTAAQSVREVVFENFTFSNNKGNGVEFFRTDNHQLIGCQINGNNTLNGPNGVGLKVRSGASNWQIIGGIIDNNYFVGIPGNQKYGIEIEGGASDNYVVQGVILRNNVTAQMSDGGTGTNKKISGVVGYVAPAIAPTLLNSWVNSGGTFEVAGYWKDAENVVHLQGTVQGGAAPSVAFVLPAGFRPAAQLKVGIDANGAHGRVDIKNSGNVEITSGAGPASFDGITFKAV